MEVYCHCYEAELYLIVMMVIQ